MTSAKNINQPAYNSNVNSWNVPVNANFNNIDDAFGSHVQVFTLSSASGTIAVSGSSYVGAYPANTASYVPLMWNVSGSLGGNTSLQLPSGIGGRWIVLVNVTGAHTLSATSAGGGYSVVLNQGTNDIFSDGTNVWVQGLPAGTLLPVAGSAAPGGFLLTYGQSLATASYPYLFSAIGYQFGGSGANFSLPDLRGRIIAGLDNMGGSAAGRLTSYTSLGFAGGEQTHLLVTGEMPVHTHADAGHTHTDAGHTHAFSAVLASGGSSGLSAPPFVFAQSTSSTTAAGAANIQTGHANNANAGGGGAHNNIQPTIALNWAIKY